MKFLAGSLALFAVLSSAHAGGFGGPPPFTNGSPLTSGTDGSYQASARGNNTSGIIRFRMSGGNQTFAGNDYIFFSEGLVFTGSTQASIMKSKISGILGTSFPVTGHTLRGFFSASLDQNSAFGSFSGKGDVITANGQVTRTTTSTTTPRVVKNGDGTTTTILTAPVVVTTDELNQPRKIGIKVKGVRTTTSGS